MIRECRETDLPQWVVLHFLYELGGAKSRCNQRNEGNETGHATPVIAELGQIRRPQLDIESGQLIVQAQDNFGTRGRCFRFVSMDAA